MLDTFEAVPRKTMNKPRLHLSDMLLLSLIDGRVEEWVLDVGYLVSLGLEVVKHLHSIEVLVGPKLGVASCGSSLLKTGVCRLRLRVGHHYVCLCCLF